MSWKLTSKKDEKIMFIADWLKEEFTFSELCKRYSITRPTGYELVKRFREEGEAAFEEKSHARHHHPNATPNDIIQLLLDLKYRHLSFGPKKLKDTFEKKYPEILCPAASTIGDILKKQGLVKQRKLRRKVPPYCYPFATCNGPNQIWSADFKGQFPLSDESLCYPLTITDNYSRFLLLCQSLEHPDTKSTIKGFQRAFEEFGLPDVIRTDNGQPFAGSCVGGLTLLSIWWLKLGILPERIAKGRPDQNGRHERMHRTLKAAAIEPKKRTAKQQQDMFDHFINEYNYERPHEGLNMKKPAEVYRKSGKQLPKKIPHVSYPDNFIVRQVKTNGNIKWKGKQYFVSELLHKEPIGLELIDDDRAIIYFSKLKLALIDARKDRITRPSLDTKV